MLQEQEEQKKLKHKQRFQEQQQLINSRQQLREQLQKEFKAFYKQFNQEKPLYARKEDEFLQK